MSIINYDFFFHMKMIRELGNNLFPDLRLYNIFFFSLGPEVFRAPRILIIFLYTFYISWRFFTLDKLQSPSFFDGTRGSKYRCWFFMFLKPILLIVSLYSEQPANGSLRKGQVSETAINYSSLFAYFAYILSIIYIFIMFIIIF